MKRPLWPSLIPLLLVAFAAGIFVLLSIWPMWWGLAISALALAAFGVGAALLARVRRSMLQACDDIFRENASASAQIMSSIGIPALLFESDGHIIWANAAFRSIYDARDIRRIVPALDTRFPPQAMPFETGGRSFQLMSMKVEREHKDARKLVFQYWVDRTEALHYSRLYEEQLPTVALIYVDNYDELTADKQFLRNTVLSEVERLISGFVTSIEGAYRRYDNARFFVVFEAKRLPELEKQRFALLDAVRALDTGTEQSVTLSIAVGAENRIMHSDESARQGMELALGRGGDQAVVKRGTSYSFYGGKRQVAVKQSRVKTRLFAKALRQLMENSDQVFVMGHLQSDMDCVGAALGIMSCAALVGCRFYLVLDESNAAIDSAVEAMLESNPYHDVIRTPEEAMALMRPSSVLVVVDTQRESAVISSELYAMASKTVIIDHHRRTPDSLPNPTLNHLEAGASSACEMVTEVIQYFDDHLKPTAFEAGALLAGITMDTKRFAFNTGARTFDAASYLRRNGADLIAVKQMFQDDMQTYRDRTQVVQRAEIIAQEIAISACPENTENAALIAAQAADELVNLKGIRASFVLARTHLGVSISGRSLGDVNVQLVLEKLGGGGHLTVAGAQLKDATMEEGKERLIESIKTYLKEAGEK